MSQRIKKYLLLIVSVLLIIFLLQKIKWLPSFTNIFKSEPVIIDETPVLIKEINNLSQIITITMYDEVVIDSSKPKHLPSFPGLRPVPDKIVLIAKGKVLAGVDLKKLSASNIFVKKDSISILLPSSEIFSAIINPSDFETFDEVGSWSEDAVRLIKIKARQKIISRALQADILGKANRKVKAVMENFLLNTGFQKININLLE